MFGRFHEEQNVFWEIGNSIEESRGPYILLESGAIATRSLSRRTHTLLLAALHGIHIHKFIVETCENSNEEIINALEERNKETKKLMLTMQYWWKF